MRPNVFAALAPRRRPRGRAAAALLPGVFALLLAGVSGVAAAAPTTIETVASSGGQIGTALTDQATVIGDNPTGKVSFSVYGPSDPSCSSAPAFHTRRGVTLTSGSATSPSFTPTAPGTYEWVVKYWGDANNSPSQTTCGSQAVKVTPNTTPTPSPSPSSTPTGSGGSSNGGNNPPTPTPTSTPKPTPKPTPSSSSGQHSGGSSKPGGSASSSSGGSGGSGGSAATRVQVPTDPSPFGALTGAVDSLTAGAGLDAASIPPVEALTPVSGLDFGDGLDLGPLLLLIDLIGIGVLAYLVRTRWMASEA